MPKYAYSVKATRYGTPTGSNTMPAASDLTALPDTVRGSITLDEGDASFTNINVDQKIPPIRRIQTAQGDVTFKMQFHDISYAVIEALKGGTAVTGASPKWQSTGEWEDIELALQVELDSGQYFNYYNAAVTAKIVGSGSRDGYFALDLSILPQMATDLSGDWEIADVPA